MRARWLIWVLPALLAVALFADSLRGLRLLGASRRLRAVALTAGSAAAAGERGAPLRAANLRLLREAEDLDPANVAAPMFRGGVQLLDGRNAEAVAAYRQALALEPRPEVYLNLARALHAAGELEEASRTFELVRRLDARLAQSAAAAPG